MFTFSLLYVFMYLFIFLGLLALVFTQIPTYVFINLSTTNLMIFIQRYIPLKNLMFFLVFTLTGLPPFGLFFVKFNMLAFILYQTHFAFIIILFFMFFLNMLFYVQLFNFRNFKKQTYHVFNASFFSKATAEKPFALQKTTYATYTLVLFIVNVLFCLIFSILFFNDFFLLLSVL